jgi:hypothetical protein
MTANAIGVCRVKFEYAMDDFGGFYHTQAVQLTSTCLSAGAID